ncbi:hypothetical protein HK101_008796, partial [Irineochytrium annulatum]
MVSFNLLQRGLIYFTIKGTNFLPLFKHGMDVYYFKRFQYQNGIGEQCQRLLFPLVCYDDFGTDWTIYSEVGCDDITVLLTLILVGFHTLLAMYHILCSCGGRNGEFLAGAEDGCCGAAAVILSVGAYDVEVELHRKSASKWRRATRFVTGGFQVAIIVAIASAIHIVTGSEATDQQRSSLFILLPALILNIFSMMENIFEGMRHFDPLSMATYDADDVLELKSLLAKASRPRVRQLLESAIPKTEKTTTIAPAADPISAPIKVTSTSQPPRAIRKITDYGWAETSKSVSVYITLPAAIKAKGEDFQPELNCTAESIELNLPENEKVVHQFKVLALDGKIVPAECTCKVKGEKCIVTLKKVKTGEWGSLVKKKKEKMPADFGKEDEPENAIMDLMKKMYTEGDDDMKKMIAKTWTESQDKQKKGLNPMSDMGGLGGMG